MKDEGGRMKDASLSFVFCALSFVRFEQKTQRTKHKAQSSSLHPSAFILS
jgi:hypothetical protein